MAMVCFQNMHNYALLPQDVQKFEYADLDF